MAPGGLKHAHRLGLNGSGKIKAPCVQMQKLIETSISSSLSLVNSILYRRSFDYFTNDQFQKMHVWYSPN